MAKDAKQAEKSAPEGEAPKKKSKKVLIIILAVVLLLVLAGGGVTFLLLKKKAAAEGDEASTGETTKKESKEHVPPAFVNLEPFTVNLVPESDQNDQFLLVVMSLEVEDAKTAETTIKPLTPKIRNDVTLLLSSKKAGEIASKEGKEKLADELRDTINRIIEPPKPGEKTKGPIKAVLFTSFIIQ
jgi:flagellar protein FliL